MTSFENMEQCVSNSEKRKIIEQT